MKKVNIIKENKEYNRIIQSIKPYKSDSFIIYVEKNENNKYQFGFSIGKKICNAVGRNKLKRQIKDILDKKDYQNGFSCIIMVRKSILKKTYLEMQQELYKLLEKINIIKEKSNEKTEKNSII